jgi:hypothetical protein
MIEFRDCLSQADANPDNTPGNKQAIVNSYNSPWKWRSAWPTASTKPCG